MVGRCIPYWNSPFLGDILVFRGVKNNVRKKKHETHIPCGSLHGADDSYTNSACSSNLKTKFNSHIQSKLISKTRCWIIFVGIFGEFGNKEFSLFHQFWDLKITSDIEEAVKMQALVTNGNTHSVPNSRYPWRIHGTDIIWGFRKMVVPNYHGFSY